MLAMIYKLRMSAQKRWRRIRGLQHRGQVIAGVKFKAGIEVNRETEPPRSVA